jgi:hypothetical protein
MLIIKTVWSPSDGWTTEIHVHNQLQYSGYFRPEEFIALFTCTSEYTFSVWPAWTMNALDSHSLDIWWFTMLIGVLEKRQKRDCPVWVSLFEVYRSWPGTALLDCYLPINRGRVSRGRG